MKSIGWIRRFSGFCIARPLAAIGVTRNHIIATRLVLGVLTGVVLAIGPAWFATGAVLFLIGMFLERADGELARLTKQATPILDRRALICYGLTNALAFVGLGIGLRAGIHGLWEIPMGVFAAASFAVLPWLVQRLDAIDGKRSAEFDGIEGIDADDALFLFPVALLVGWAEGALMVAAFGGTAFVCALYATHFRKFHPDSSD